MESLAMVVFGMLIGMLVSVLAALIVSWRAKEFGTRVVAVVLGMPGAFLGGMFIVGAGSPGAWVLGLIGLLGCAVPTYRLWSAQREPAQD